MTSFNCAVLFFLLDLACVCAPSGTPLGELLGARARQSVAVACAATMATTAAVLLASAESKPKDSKPGITDVVSSDEDACSANSSSLEDAGTNECVECFVDSDSECDYDAEPEDDADATGPSTAATVVRSLSGKLWTRRQFPEGTSGSKNFELGNLRAAQVC